jgi:hypothetical protein
MGKKNNRKKETRKTLYAASVTNFKNNGKESKVEETKIMEIKTETKEVDKKETKTTGNTAVSTTNNTNGKSNFGFNSYYKPPVNYDYMGNKNEASSFKVAEFVGLCKRTQKDLKKELEWLLVERGYTDIVNGSGYLYAKGTIPVLLTAHMDTVHQEPVKDFYDYYHEEKKQHIISSPQGIGGDDRCGIYMILEIIKTHNCSVLFCEDEESGGVGSRKFCKTELIEELETMKYLIELDRKGNNDAVFYDCENDDFTKFIEKNTGFKKDYGSFSDISTLSPACKVASVNLSCGYYNAHRTSEYVVMEEMFNTIEVVKKLLDVECEQFEYIEDEYSKYNSWYYGSGYNYNGYSGYSGYKTKEKTTTPYYDGFYDADDDDYYNRKSEEKSLLIHVLSSDERSVYTYIANATTKIEAFGKFFDKHFANALLNNDSGDSAQRLNSEISTVPFSPSDVICVRLK